MQQGVLLKCARFNGSTVFLFTTHVQHYVIKTNIKKKKGGGNRIYNPRGLVGLLIRWSLCLGLLVACTFIVLHNMVRTRPFQAESNKGTIDSTSLKLRTAAKIIIIIIMIIITTITITIF